MTLTPQSWARDLLGRLGYPVTANNMASVLAWEYQEGGHFHNNARFNPLNTTLNHQRYGAINAVGVARYPDYETGMRETIATINESPYAKIRQALRASAPPSTTTAAIKASPWGTWHGGGDPASLVKRARSEVAAHPSWYDSSPKHKAGTKTHPRPAPHRHPSGGARSGSKQRLVVYPAELADVVERLRKESDSAAYIDRGIARHDAELDAFTSSGWTVPDPVALSLVRRHLDSARTGPRGAAAAAEGLGDTASWVDTFRAQIVAADGPATGGRTKPHPAAPSHPPAKHPAAPHVSSRTQKVHRLLAVAETQFKRHVNDGGTNHTPYGAWFGGDGGAWCAMFVSWVFAHAHLPLPRLDGPGKKGTSGFWNCHSALNYARAHGQLHEKPRAGDIMLYNDGEHTGIVTKVYPNGTFDTIEGNAGPGDTTVAHNHHSLGDSTARAHEGYRFWRAIS
jgi:hypothetical protein